MRDYARGNGPLVDKIEQWVERAHGLIRTDVAHAIWSR
jgi:hypothetical protein